MLVVNLLGELLPAHANLTLRQRDLLLEDSSLPVKEQTSLRGLPLFSKALFPVDFEALEEKLQAKQVLSSQALANERIAQIVISSASNKGPSGSSKPVRQAKKATSKPPKTVASSKASVPAPQKQDKRGKKPAGKKVFRGAGQSGPKK